MSFLLFIFGFLLLLAACVYTSYLIEQKRSAYHDQQRKEQRQLALACNPLYQHKIEGDRQHELATRKLDLDQQKADLAREQFLFEQETAALQISIPQYGLLWRPSTVHDWNVIAPIHKPPSLKEQEAITSDGTPILTFRELLEQGIIQAHLAQNKLLLGYYTNGQLRTGTWLDLYSCGIGGVPGTGKTTTVRFLLYQAVLAGATLIMLDPHIAEVEESLAAEFGAFSRSHWLPPCGDRPQDVLKRVRALAKELQRRKATGIKTPALILVVDEYNAIMRSDKQVRDELSALLVAIAQEGRKFGLFAMLIGQRWSAQDIGGADIRTSLASTLAHRFTDEEQAKKLVGGRYGSKCLELQKGHFLFRDTEGTLNEMITPLTLSTDADCLLQIVGSTPSRTHSEPSQSGYEPLETMPLLAPENGSKNGSNGVHEPVTEAPEAERMRIILKMHAEGKNMAEVIKSVWGISPSKSQEYEKAKEAYKNLMKLAHESLS